MALIWQKYYHDSKVQPSEYTNMISIPIGSFEDKMNMQILYFMIYKSIIYASNENDEVFIPIERNDGHHDGRIS